MSDTGNISAERGRDWPRAGFSVAFLFMFAFGQSLFYTIAFVQLVWFLIAREPNPFLRHFGASLGRWLAEAVRYICMDTEEKPFPWMAWPSA
jgi:hypothetical protein